MAVVKRHDVIQTGFMIDDRKRDVSDVMKNKHSWSELTWQERDKVIKDLHATEVNDIRQHANLAVDHQKMLKAEYTETWTGTLGERETVTKGRKAKRLFVFSNPKPDVDPQPQSVISILGLELSPKYLSGFQALKNKYQYFKINKISLRFVANSAANLSPIICRYIPPMAKYANLDDMDKDIQSGALDLEYVTKCAESKGSEYGYTSVHCPPCLIKIGEYDKDGEFSYGANGMCLANLCTDRCICDFATFGQQLDYGAFIFESRNMNEQSVIAQIHYCVDFYTGIDFEAAAYGESSWPVDDGEEDGGDDDDGDSREVINGTVPGKGPQKGMFKKTYKK